MTDLLRTHPTSGEAEPAAGWRYECDGLARVQLHRSPGLTSIGYAETPLYAHPPITQPIPEEVAELVATAQKVLATAERCLVPRGDDCARLRAILDKVGGKG